MGCPVDWQALTAEEQKSVQRLAEMYRLAATRKEPWWAQIATNTVGSIYRDYREQIEAEQRKQARPQ